LFGQVFGEQPGADIVVVADLVADHERELAALVELLGALCLRSAGKTNHKGRRGDQPIHQR
jgi:hypothetical protein